MNINSHNNKIQLIVKSAVTMASVQRSGRCNGHKKSLRLAGTMIEGLYNDTMGERILAQSKRRSAPMSDRNTPYCLGAVGCGRQKFGGVEFTIHPSSVISITKIEKKKMVPF